MNLVTGATGHIGNVLVRWLRQRGEPVRALVLPGEDLTPLAGMEVDIVPGDVLKPESLKKAMEGVDTVFHLAGMISIMPGANPLVQRINVDGTRNIVEACRRQGVRRLVYTSSIHALGRPAHGVLIDESIPFDPEHAISSYDHAKAQASLEVLAAAKTDLDAVIACPTGVIGPWDFRRSEMGSIILDCVRGKDQYFVDGAYDFVDVRDVAAGLVQARDHGQRGETYILSGEQISVQRLLHTLWEITGGRFKRLHIPFSLAKMAAWFTPLYYRISNSRPRFTPYSLATLASNSTISHAKASQVLGYAPRPMSQTLADTAHWFAENLARFKRR
jgi:dihydroflavonol-4-reductase